MATDIGIYNLVRPLPSFLGQLNEIQQQETGRQHQQLNQLEIESRQQAAQQRAQSLRSQQTIDQLMQSSMGPDGTVDATKLKQGFVRSGLGHLWPQVDEQLTKVQEAHTKLGEALDKADTDENEKLASTFAFLNASGNDPNTAIQTLQALTQHGVSASRVAPLLQQLQQAPTADTVKAIGAPYVTTSKTQTGLAAERARTADTTEQIADRTQTRERQKKTDALANASRMMYTSGMRDPTGAERRAVRAGLSTELQQYFDENFDPKTTPDLDLNAAETPNQIALRRQAAANAAETVRRNQVVEAQRVKAEKDLTEARQDAARHRRWIESHSSAVDPDEKKDVRAYGFYRSDQQREYTAKMAAWRATQNTAGAFDKQGNPIPPPDYEPPQEYDDWRRSKSERKKGGAATLPKGLTPGATVTLKNGKKVVVKTVNPDGSFTAE